MRVLTWEEQRLAKISDMIGKVATKVREESDELIFDFEDGTQYRFYHEQDCCESVSIEDIAGDLNDLVGSPLTMAEEVTSLDDFVDTIEDSWGSHTWTFYKFATVKGYVTVRWLGESNGYYSESVYFERLR